MYFSIWIMWNLFGFSKHLDWKFRNKMDDDPFFWLYSAHLIFSFYDDDISRCMYQQVGFTSFWYTMKLKGFFPFLNQWVIWICWISKNLGLMIGNEMDDSWFWLSSWPWKLMGGGYFSFWLFTPDFSNDSWLLYGWWCLWNFQICFSFSFLFPNYQKFKIFLTMI